MEAENDETQSGVTTPSDNHSDTYELFEAEQEEQKGKSSVFDASFNFVNSVIGSGVISMPYALRRAGIGLGLIIIILVALVTDVSIRLLIRAGQLCNVNSFQDVVRTAFGRPGFILLTIMQFAYPLIAMISYNIIIGDTITKLVQNMAGDRLAGTVLTDRYFIIFLVNLVCMLPLCLYRNITRLSKWALASLICVVIVMIFMFVRGVTYHVPHTPKAWKFASEDFTQAIGLCAHAFMCTHNSFLLYNSLKDQRVQTWNKVTDISIGVSTIVTIGFGVLGYVSFTGYTQGDVLENYCLHDILMNIGRAVFAISVILTYPIECFVCREVIEVAVFAGSQSQSLFRHVVETIAIVFIILLLSYTTDCLAIVVAINGVVVATPLAFILPPLCYLRLQQSSVLSVENIPALLVVAFGVFTFIAGIIELCLYFPQYNRCSHGKEMPYCYESSLGVPGNYSNVTIEDRIRNMSAFVN